MSLFPNNVRCTKNYRKRRLRCNFILFKNSKSIFGLLAWYLHKKDFFFKKSSKTNCGLVPEPQQAFFVPTGILNNTRPDPSSIWLSAGSSFCKGPPVDSHACSLQSLAHSAGAQKNLTVAALGLVGVGESRKGGREGEHAEVQQRIKCAGNKAIK